MAEAEVGDDVYGEDPTVNRLEERAARDARHGGGALRAVRHDGQRDRDPAADPARRRGAVRAPQPRGALRARRDERPLGRACRACWTRRAATSPPRTVRAAVSPPTYYKSDVAPGGAREHPQPGRRHRAASRGAAGRRSQPRASAASASTWTGRASGTRRWRSASRPRCSRPASTPSWPACRRASALRSARSSPRRATASTRRGACASSSAAACARPASSRRPVWWRSRRWCRAWPRTTPTRACSATALALGRGVRLAPVETNIVVGVLEGRSALEAVAALAERGVLAAAMDAQTLRLVTHRDVSRQDCERAAEAIEVTLKHG